MTKAIDRLAEALATYKERNAVYGNNYELVGRVMVALFPDGLTAKTAHDWERLHIFLLAIVKLTRYAKNWEAGGHDESLIDTQVYAAILSEIDGKGK